MLEKRYEDFKALHKQLLSKYERMRVFGSGSFLGAALRPLFVQVQRQSPQHSFFFPAAATTFVSGSCPVVLAVSICHRSVAKMLLQFDILVNQSRLYPSLSYWGSYVQI